MPKTDILKTRPEAYRGPITKGLAAAVSTEEKPIDRTGGYKEAGIIRGYAVISRSEALGHGFWVDSEMLRQTAEALNVSGGIKSRLTHPGLSSDGIEKHLGRTFDAVVDGDVVRADLHFTKTAHKSPHGDIAEYVMSLAEETPDDFGASIVFVRDVQAEVDFMTSHGARVIDPDWGEYDVENFTSPDPLNTEKLAHVRLKELDAADVVGDPAANPSGMFGRGQQIPMEADALVAYALGLSKDKPATSALGIDPDRLRGFATKFMTYRGLSVVSKDKEMSKKLSAAVAEPVADEAVETPAVEATETPAEPVVESESQEAVAETETPPVAEETAPVVEETPAPVAEAPVEALSGRDLCRQYIELFGAESGAGYFADGLDLSAAYAAHNQKLKAELAATNERLKAALAAAGEETPVSSTPFDAKPAVAAMSDGEKLEAFAATLSVTKKS